MNFILKKSTPIGVVTPNDDGTYNQHLNITVTVEDCPYDDIKVEKTIKYTFDGTMTAKEIERGIAEFAIKWVETNYPKV